MVLPPSETLLAAGIFPAFGSGSTLWRRNAHAGACIGAADIVDDDGTKQIRCHWLYCDDGVVDTTLSFATEAQPGGHRCVDGGDRLFHVCVAFPCARV